MTTSNREWWMMERWVVVIGGPGSGASFTKTRNGIDDGRTSDPMLADHWPTPEGAIDEANAIRRREAKRGDASAFAARIILKVEGISPDEHLQRWAERLLQQSEDLLRSPGGGGR